MRDGPLAGRAAVVSGGGRGLGRSFCLALARQGAKVVVSNRNRVTDADGRGPADHVVSEITAAGGEAVADYSDAADPAGGEAIVAAAGLRADHPGRLHRRPARRPRAFRLRGQQGRPARVRPVAGGGGGRPGRGGRCW